MASPSPALPSPDATPQEDPQTQLIEESFIELDKLSLKEILDQDSRPTFVVDLDASYVADHAIQPIFSNAALRVHKLLLSSITGATIDNVSIEGPGGTATYSEFRNWTARMSRHNETRDILPVPLRYHGLLWTGFTLRQRWRIVSGNALFEISNVATDNSQSSPSTKTKTDRGPAKELGSAAMIPTNDVLPTHVQQSKPASGKLSKNTGTHTIGSGSSVTLATPDNAVPDWTILNPRGILTEYMKFARKVDWASTPLGPMEEWSVQFRELANLVMRNPYPTALFWGEELTTLYNETYGCEIAGTKHPGLMGTGFSGPFKELWDVVGPVFHECAQTGHSERRENDPLSINRHGYLEETFISWSIIPIYGGTDRILGFYCAPFETTSQMVSSRRIQMLRHLGESLNGTRTVKDFWGRVLDGLVHNCYDVPFALLYSITDSDDADTASQSSVSATSSKSCLLEGSIGVPRGHAATSPKLELKGSQEGFIPAFRHAMRTREPTILDFRHGKLPESFLEGIEWRGYGDPCKEAIIFPLRPTNGDTVFAFLLIGVNPRRAYDEDYKDFAAMLNRQLATSLASVLLFEDEVRESRHAAESAAQQTERLSKQLELQTNRMRRMTELSPFGMYLYDPKGVLVEANERYLEMSGTSKEDNEEFGFKKFIAEGSQQVVQDMWDEMMTTLKPVVRELQFNHPKVQPRDLSGKAIEYWVLASSSPEVGPDGEVVSVMGSIADISHMKWVHGLQETRLREAEETKRQQNEFIDITSHEMRNPLSAILICADDIRDTLMQHKFRVDDQQVITECVEAARNIALCVQHQKSIVDDILTISKLDSNLLLITPTPTQPAVAVQRVMSMFYPECQAKGIEFCFKPHVSLERYNIDWVLLDPTRLSQITVNLITNAIKFTQHSPKRSILVHLSASLDHPEMYKCFDYVPTRGSPVDVTSAEEWGSGQLLYLHVDVEDTGCGLTAEEKALLFEKFAQASPRTHAHYGGSGLGLFISRRLTELHGGQIGVSSEAGFGSTFSFFLQCKRFVPNSCRPALLNQHSNISQSTEHDDSSNSIVVATESEPDLSNATVDILLPSYPEKLHILIVEDNLLNQRVLAKQLIKAGSVISTADNGLFALEHLTKSSFYTSNTNGLPLSIILMDWEMPDMDGLTCCKKIREMERSGELNAHVPILGVTANVRPEQVATAKESGMDDLLSKPFRVHQLLNKIRELLDRLNVNGDFGRTGC